MCVCFVVAYCYRSDHNDDDDCCSSTTAVALLPPPLSEFLFHQKTFFVIFHVKLNGSLCVICLSTLTAIVCYV